MAQSFLKKYNDDFRFNNIFPFTDENGNKEIFATGKLESNNTGIIIKIDENGNQLWSKSYTIDGLNNPILPIKIIKLAQNKYLTHAHTESGQHFLITINGNGNILNVKNIQIPHGFSSNFNVFLNTLEIGYYSITISKSNHANFCDPIFAVFDINSNLKIAHKIPHFEYNPMTGSYVEAIIQSVDFCDNRISFGTVDQYNIGHIIVYDTNHAPGDYGNTFWKIYKLNIKTNIRYEDGIEYYQIQPFECIINNIAMNTLAIKTTELEEGGTITESGNGFDIGITGNLLSNNNDVFLTRLPMEWESKTKNYIYAINDTSNAHSSLLTSLGSMCVCLHQKNKNESQIINFDTSIHIDLNLLHTINITFSSSYVFSIPEQISSTKIIKQIRGSAPFFFNIDDTSIIGGETFPYPVSSTIYLKESSENWKGLRQIGEFIPLRDNAHSQLINIELGDTIGKSSNIGNSILQSPYVALLAAGSGESTSPNYDGSAEGIHLRWLFNGKLGENHLPKGNISPSTHNFNKGDDFVKILKAPYIRKAKTLDVTSILPNTISNEEKYWQYLLEDKHIKLWFRNKRKYNETASEIILNSDISSYVNFLKEYGNELLELEIIDDEMFFNVKMNVENTTSKAELKVETISYRLIPSKVSGISDVEFSEKPAFAKTPIISLRKTYKKNNDELTNIVLTCENGHAIRYKLKGAELKSFEFEFYSDVINQSSWEPVGDYALTNSNESAFLHLEPTPNMINNKWPKFVNGTSVNMQNYMDRWDANDNEWDIKKIVNKYLQYSEEEENPRAILKMDDYVEVIKNEVNNKPLIADIKEDDNNIPLIDLLNLGAMDFHVARMLGLGTIDYTSEVKQGNSFVYMLEYLTKGDLEDGRGVCNTRHIYMTLPTSINDERLPAAIEIDKLQPGLVSEETNNPNESKIDLKDGYTPDGRSRYVTLLAKEEVDFKEATTSFFSGKEFEAHKHAPTVFAGVQHKMNSDTAWRVPDISYDTDTEETIPLTVSKEKRIIYVHQQRESGTHHYKSYAINIFSRTNKDYSGDDKKKSIYTDLVPGNLLQAPSNTQAYHVREENPCILSTLEDQTALSNLKENSSKNDKTLIRLTFDYNSNHDTYTHRVDPMYNKIPDNQIINGIPNNTENPTILFPDNMETYADKIYINFRNSFPRDISGIIVSVKTQEDTSIITTGSHTLINGKILNPEILQNEVPNFINSTLVLGDEQYTVLDIDTSGKFPKITVKNNKLTAMQIGAIAKKNKISEENIKEIQAPTIDKLFSMIENMQNPCSWANTDINENTHVIVKIPNWETKRELFTNIIEEKKVIGGVEETNTEIVRTLQKSRGFWIDAQNAIIAKVNEKATDGTKKHLGCYSVTFPSSFIPDYQTFFDSTNQPAYIHNIQWHNGQVRLHKENGERKRYDVILVKKSELENETTLYFHDPEFTRAGNNPDAFGTSQTVNYYPGYKVYLYANDVPGLTENALLPNTIEKIRYSIFGLRSHDSRLNYTSNFCMPAAMFSQRTTPPQQPEKPTGALYTTRPDSFGRSSYSFLTKYNHEPDNLLFYRSNDSSILHAVYTMSTAQEIQRRLDELGGIDEECINDRWKNFFDFQKLESIKQYGIFPDNEYGYRLPLPDVEKINSYIKSFEKVNNLEEGTIDTITSVLPMDQEIIPIEFCGEGGSAKTVIDIIKESIYATFVPLTEYPIVYDYIESKPTHSPSNKKQNVRNKDGRMMVYGDKEFDMAPMAKVYKKGSGQPEVLFVDYTIDASTRNALFYCSREMNTQMNMGEFSTPVGPIKPVNTNPPVTPQIKWALPVLKEASLDIEPAIEFQINAYPKADNVRKITIYRATDKADTKYTRTMKNIGSIMLEKEGMLDDDIWVFYDKFTGLEEVPYGDPLYYCITVSREFQYAPDNMPEDAIYLTDYAISEPSKLIVTMIMDNEVPDAPVVECNLGNINNDGKLTNINLRWKKTMYKGKYHVYQMNSQGNWSKLSDNITTTGIYCTYTISELQKVVGEENLYHHFKVVAENTSGMLSTEENIFTI